MDTIIKEKHLRNPERDATEYIKALKREAKGSPLVSLGSQGAIYSHILEQNLKGQIRAWYDATGKLVGLLMFDVGRIWWSDKIVIMEETVFCLDKSYSGIQREATRELDRIARGYSAEIIVTGNMISTGDTERLVMNGYKKAGYTTICTDMIKVVKYE
jgi:hypothetical protein|nr:MAG TPA: Glucose-6-phosphate acetyltransferase 1 fold, GlcNAc biosynthesis, alpha/beta [Caudoviricetes sp.]